MNLFMYTGNAENTKAKRKSISFTEIRIKLVKGRKPLTGAKLRDFEDFLQKYADQIVQKWVDYFVYHKDILFEQITNLK